jgi:hypothetical protein
MATMDVNSAALAWRISIHEASHAVCARLLSLENCGMATVEPGNAHAEFPSNAGPASLVALMAGATAEQVLFDCRLELRATRPASSSPPELLGIRPRLPASPATHGTPCQAAAEPAGAVFRADLPRTCPGHFSGQVDAQDNLRSHCRLKPKSADCSARDFSFHGSSGAA